MGTQFLHFLWQFDGQSDKVRHTMTKIANVLAVATVLIGLWTLISTFDRQRRGGAYRRDKVQGGGCARGGVILGFCGNIINKM